MQKPRWHHVMNWGTWLIQFREPKVRERKEEKKETDKEIIFSLWDSVWFNVLSMHHRKSSGILPRSRVCTGVNSSKISPPGGCLLPLPACWPPTGGNSDFWRHLPGQILLSGNFALHSLTIPPPCTFCPLSGSRLCAWQGLGHPGTQNFHIDCFMLEPPAPEQEPS